MSTSVDALALEGEVEDAQAGVERAAEALRNAGSCETAEDLLANLDDAEAELQAAVASIRALRGEVKDLLKLAREAVRPGSAIGEALLGQERKKR